MVPKDLNDDQKAGRKEVSAVMLRRFTAESNFLIRVITGDERRFFKYDPETRGRVRNCTRHSLREESSHEEIKNQENCHIFFFDSRGKIKKKITTWCYNESKILS
jgi:hypothetical protein